MVITLPLIEAIIAILEVFRRITILSLSRRVSGSSSRSEEYTSADFDPNRELMLEENHQIRKLLVAIDGSKESLRALNYASYLFGETIPARIILLNVIEWTDENDESLDEVMSDEMLQAGRKMLRSVLVPRFHDYERIVKLGDPANKIVETAEKLDVDMILMGTKGLGNNQSDLGHVTKKVLQARSKPVVLLT
jgi:nucleotide-binding universal stress UspA family protein